MSQSFPPRDAWLCAASIDELKSGRPIRALLACKAALRAPQQKHDLKCDREGNPKCLRNLLPKLSALAGLAAAGLIILAAAAPVKAEEPIKIGFGMSLTGPLAANGKMSLVAMQVWEADINAQGGLLGRPVKLVYYDDQSKPAEVPAIYSKLLDVDKVDLIVSGYASTQIAAAMPIAIGRKKLFVSLFGTGINNVFQLRQILRDDPERADFEARLHARLFQGRRNAKAEAEDNRAHLCGCRIRAERVQRPARERQSIGLHRGLRQELSAGDGRFHAHHARNPG